MVDAPRGAGDLFGIVGTVQARVFHVEKAVAEGGFGVVYRAQHEVFRSPIALKCLKLPEGLTEAQKSDFLERFRGEAELLFRLSAALPEVVRPLQFGVLEARTLVPFLALEWLEGETLDRFVSTRTAEGKPPLSLTQALEVLAPVARVLARAHQFNDRGQDVTIVHRDVKPENVFLSVVDGERITRILDFGIARVKLETNAIAGRATGADALNAFSPAYAAPEQWSPETYGSSGPHTDVYGLALTLTEVLLGKPPIMGDLTAMMGAALNPEWRPTPRGKGMKVSDAVEKALSKALAVDPRQRTQSIEALWTQLELAAGKKPSITRRMGTSSSLLHSAPPPPPDLELELELPSPPVKAAARAPAPAPAPAKAAAPDFSAAIDSSPRPPPAGGAPLGPSPPSAGSLDLDVAGPVRSEPRRPSRDNPMMWRPGAMAGGAFGGRNPIDMRPSRTLGERFGGPAWLVVIAFAIAGGDLVAANLMGTHLALGPIRPLYVAGPLGVLGIVLALVRLFEE